MKMRRNSSSSRNPDRPNAPSPTDAGTDPLPFIESRKGGLYIRVKLTPRASREKVDGIAGDALKIRITAPPVEGEANRALVNFLSGLTKLSKSSFSIAPASLKSKLKLVKVEGASEKELRASLSAALGSSGITPEANP